MICSVEIKGLRGIREGKLSELTPLVVLVGPNGSGKSTILDALLIGANPRPPEAVCQAAARRQEVSGSARWLSWKAGGEGPTKITVAATGNVTRICEFAVTSYPDGHATIQGSVKTRQGGQQLNESELSAVFQKDGQVGASGFFQPLPDVPEVRFLDPQLAILRTPLHQLYTKIVEQGLRAQAWDTLTALVPEVQDIQILAEGENPVLYLIYRDRAVPAALAGEGIRRLLHFSLELSTRRGGLVLMEEPEVHMHPGAIRQCARAIVAAVRRGVQIVLTTLSLELIDALLSECTDEDLERFSIPRLQLDGGALKTFRSKGEEIAFARNTIEEDLR